MDKELSEAFNVISSKSKLLKEHFNTLSNEVAVLENKKTALSNDIKGIEKTIKELELARADLQFFIDSKKKEDEIKTIVLKQGTEEIQRKTDLLGLREANLDAREARIKDREQMYRIKPEG